MIALKSVSSMAPLERKGVGSTGNAPESGVVI
jgi:hypothetical protein